MDKLIALDKAFFKLLNYKWHNDFFDFLMPWLRNADMWAPLYFFLILLLTVNYKKRGWWWVCFFLVTVIISNYVSSNIIKGSISRIRPCGNPDFAGWIRVLVNYCPVNSSFVSSHATNHFAMALFLYLTLKNNFGKWVGLFFLWAFMISYAQIYVGVHYPVDVISGAIVGLIIGFIMAKIFNHYFGLPQPAEEVVI